MRGSFHAIGLGPPDLQIDQKVIERFFGGREEGDRSLWFMMAKKKHLKKPDGQRRRTTALVVLYFFDLETCRLIHVICCWCRAVSKDFTEVWHDIKSTLGIQMMALHGTSWVSNKKWSRPQMHLF